MRASADHRISKAQRTAGGFTGGPTDALHQSHTRQPPRNRGAGVGESCVGRARVGKPRKSQVCTACELFARKDGQEILVATGETLLLVIADGKSG